MDPMTPQPDRDGAWLAPAKLNLMLRVLGRRSDGYHRLQTVFQFIDRCDRLFIEVRSDGQIRRLAGAEGIEPEDDLVVRAARALQAVTGASLGADIRVDKQLPMGGGLGGGSSDAATTLKALNALWETGLDEDALSRLAVRLGADVPVFLRGWAAWAEGVGEELTPVRLPTPWYLVLAPPSPVSTAAVFGDPALTRDSPPITLADFLRGDRRNDCLATVRAHHPAVREAFDWLDARAAAHLTGTGACLFAAFDQRGEAEHVLQQVPPTIPAFVARGRNRSPLFAPSPAAGDVAEQPARG